MEHWKVLSATMVFRQEKFSYSRRSRMIKLLIVSALKPFLFPLCLPFFFLLHKKVGGGHGPSGHSGVAGPELNRCWVLNPFLNPLMLLWKLKNALFVWNELKSNIMCFCLDNIFISFLILLCEIFSTVSAFKCSNANHELLNFLGAKI